MTGSYFFKILFSIQKLRQSAIQLIDRLIADIRKIKDSILTGQAVGKHILSVCHLIGNPDLCRVKGNNCSIFDHKITQLFIQRKILNFNRTVPVKFHRLLSLIPATL